MSVYPLILFQIRKNQGFIYHCKSVYFVLGILLLLFSIVVIIKNIL